MRSGVAQSRRKHKVVLYNPADIFFTMPLALVAVASHLDPRIYDVRIIDGRLESNPIDAIAPHLDEAICFGVTVMTGAPIKDAIHICRAVKERRPDLTVVWGGWHPSMFGTECLQEPAVDITVQGQGEETFCEILDRLVAGSSMAHCAGCCYRGADGEVKVNPARPFKNINAFGEHRYELFDVERFFALKGKRQLDYISSQGCPFRCAFCADPFVFGRQYAGFTPQRMGAEIEALWRKYQFDDLNFQDETYFTYAKRVAGVADELIKRKLPITWAGTMRADQCYRLPEEVFAKCRESGLRRVLMGVETGSESMIKKIKKDIKLEHVLFAAQRCKKYGVDMHIPFIIGFPDETAADVQASLDLIKHLRSISSGFQTPIFYFKPYPGTSITQQAVEGGFSLPCDLEGWSDFAFVESDAGPWVTPQRHQLVERFKFFQQLAFDEACGWKQMLKTAAKWRCRNDFYGLPIERILRRWLHPGPQMS
ncbi:MAG: radical SAM protein [Gammaproteobacteria bacterium]|nr:radical SAM protein [Gammaproteobacteria bacterium]